MADQVVDNIQFMFKYQYFSDQSKFTNAPMKSNSEIASENAQIAFIDVQFWFSKKDCDENNVEHIKKIWDRVKEAPSQKAYLDSFLRRYAEEVVDKSNKLKALIETLRQIDIMRQRTEAILKELRENTDDNISEFQPQVSEKSPRKQLHISFEVIAIEEFNVVHFQSDSRLHNYYLEFVYMDEAQRLDAVLSALEMRLNFKNKNTFEMDLGFDIGNLQVNLVRELDGEKKIIAIRNLDPFTSISKEVQRFPLLVPESKTYLNLQMKIQCDQNNIEGFLNERLDYLQLKHESIYKKSHLYKAKLRVLLQPFDVVKYDEDGIYLQKIQEKKKKKAACHACTIS